MSDSVSKQWQNRIVSQGVKPASQFLANSSNWRVHPKSQQEALSGVLSEIGWVQNVIENVQTGNLIDGHLRVMEALRLGDDTPVPYVQVDLTEQEEALILATFDPISALAVADKEILDQLLREVSTGEAAVQQMLAELAAKNGLYPDGVTDPIAEWQGMPEFANEPKAVKTIHIHFETLEDMRSFAKLTGFKITESTVTLWYPEKQRKDMTTMRFENES